MAAAPLPPYGGRVVRAPHLARLAEEGVVFESAYCNSPICAPSRFSMLTGRLPGEIGAWDNASELPASLPTFAHYLCAAGYRTILSGKMHFIGPDQLHGFEERLTTDIYPADFSWTPNWRAGPADKPSGISMQNVVQAGLCVRSLQMDYDDEVEYFAVQRLFDLARETDRPPFFMTVSFSHPHPPYTIGAEHWHRYRHEDIDMPAVPPIALAARDVHSQWLHVSHGADLQPISEEQVRLARHAYYGMISYVDDKIGRLMETLAACGFADDTIVVFTADHGEMLGERGMWYKQCFFEPSVRVPLVVHAPGRHARGRVAVPVSLLDLLPTFLDWAGGRAEFADPVGGESLAGILDGGTLRSRTIVSEYTDMGVIAPCRMVRRGAHKLLYTHGHPHRLYRLDRDPLELDDLAGRSDSTQVEGELLSAVLDGWDPRAVLADVLASQRRRLFLKDVMRRSGRLPHWSYQASRDDSRRYVRSHGAAGAKARARFPYVPPPDGGP
jgi:choline-sulfatase